MTQCKGSGEWVELADGMTATVAMMSQDVDPVECPECGLLTEVADFMADLGQVPIHERR